MILIQQKLQQEGAVPLSLMFYQKVLFETFYIVILKIVTSRENSLQYTIFSRGGRGVKKLFFIFIPVVIDSYFLLLYKHYPYLVYKVRFKVTKLIRNWILNLIKICGNGRKSTKIVKTTDFFRGGWQGVKMIFFKKNFTGISQLWTKEQFPHTGLNHFEKRWFNPLPYLSV